MAGQALGLGRDVGQEGAALFVAEQARILAKERLREARKSTSAARAARARRSRRTDFLLDEAIRRDVAERIDTAGDGTGWITHDVASVTEPDLVASARDRIRPRPSSEVSSGSRLR